MTFEGINAFPVRDISLRSEASVQQQKFRLICLTSLCPHRVVITPRRRRNEGIELRILPQVPCLSHVSKVSAKLRATRKTLLPHPILPQCWIREFVVGNGTVYTGAGISIPVPHSAIIGSVLDEFDAVACIADDFELIKILNLRAIGGIGAVRSAAQGQLLAIVDSAHISLKCGFQGSG
jgi:hypothetical protein